MGHKQVYLQYCLGGGGGHIIEEVLDRGIEHDGSGSSDGTDSDSGSLYTF